MRYLLTGSLSGIRQDAIAAPPPRCGCLAACANRRVPLSYHEMGVSPDLYARARRVLLIVARLDQTFVRIQPNRVLLRPTPISAYCFFILLKLSLGRRLAGMIGSG
jgi:hypothetical protein